MCIIADSKLAISYLSLDIPIAIYTRLFLTQNMPFCPCG
ncbi:hypothetical protein HC081234_00450 [Helicobacter cinaedi]|nr:hypothetical protein HC081234_00450 [Helicobacter cinaedi]